MASEISNLKLEHQNQIQEIKNLLLPSCVQESNFNSDSTSINVHSNEMELKRPLVFKNSITNPNATDFNEVAADDESNKHSEALHNLAVQIKKLREADNSAVVNNKTVARCSNNTLSRNESSIKTLSFSRKPLSIPWNNRILSPTISQLRECEGRVNLVASRYGSREMKPEERLF